MKRNSPTSQTIRVTALIVGLAACIASLVHVSREQIGDSPQVLKKIESTIAKTERPPFSIESLMRGEHEKTWNDFQSNLINLDETNKRIARARLMIKLHHNPDPDNAAEWNESEYWAKKQ